MNTARLLHVIALVSAWARADSEAVELLLQTAEKDLVADLIEFNLMVLQHNTENNAPAYLDYLSEQALAIQANEARR